MFREKVVVYIPKERFHPRSFVRVLTRCCHNHLCTSRLNVARGGFDTKTTKIELMSDGNIRATLEYVNFKSIFQTFGFLNSVTEMHARLGVVAAEMHFPEYDCGEMYRFYEYRNGRLEEETSVLRCSQVVVEG